MKRELKGLTSAGRILTAAFNRKAHPDEKGTERLMKFSTSGPLLWDRKAHPDEKGTESLQNKNASCEAQQIARPIPMKRELKVCDWHSVRVQYWVYRKAHPDEKGTESANILSNKRCVGVDRKAHPDEKGTESLQCGIYRLPRMQIARPIPMKRELKVLKDAAFKT